MSRNSRVTDPYTQHRQEVEFCWFNKNRGQAGRQAEFGTGWHGLQYKQVCGNRQSGTGNGQTLLVAVIQETGKSRLGQNAERARNKEAGMLAWNADNLATGDY